MRKKPYRTDLHPVRVFLVKGGRLKNSRYMPGITICTIHQATVTAPMISNGVMTVRVFLSTAG